LGNGQAVSLLLSSTRQASKLMARGLSPEETRALHLEWFNNLCSLSGQYPPLTTHQPDRPFWKEIERVLKKNRREGF